MAARVLVVEDDQDALRMYIQLLLAWGYEAHGATSAAEALNRMRSNCPDVVLSDLVMPGMSGLDLLKAIRGMDDCPVAFFLITGHGGVSIAVTAIQEGADECLLKPIEPATLHAKLEARGFYGRP